jgi:hypothetical protein
MTLQERYEALKQKIQHRKAEFDALVEMLEKQTSWLTGPASSRFHLNEEGGLLRHSVTVAENLLQFRELLAPIISDESCVIVGLFHDVGKIGMPGRPLYVENDNLWEVRNRNMRYKTNGNLVEMSLGARSLYLVSGHISLSETEAQAILCHDGQYVKENTCVAHREEPLTLLVHWADYWTAHVLEEERQAKKDILY